MSEKWLMRFVKAKVKEMGLRDKLDFFQWLMKNLLDDLGEEESNATKTIKQEA